VTGLGDCPVLARAIDACLFSQGRDVAIRCARPVRDRSRRWTRSAHLERQPYRPAPCPGGALRCSISDGSERRASCWIRIRRWPPGLRTIASVVVPAARPGRHENTSRISWVELKNGDHLIVEIKGQLGNVATKKGGGRTLVSRGHQRGTTTQPGLSTLFRGGGNEGRV
jgi:hypothetical protein